ncbi:MAG TPA: Crp/Fnr family transcriptional regulator [Gammaproteobacteria bacterium]|nr:Crp/Fnr family transcriptional regulator [Gammaproteobacteria bacterium]
MRPADDIEALEADSVAAASTRTAKAVLQKNILFRGLSEAALERIASIATRRHYSKGAVIFAQGQPGDALFAVITGQVRISATGVGGQEVFLNIMEPGDAFGEVAVMDGLPRTAGASALDDTSLIVIRRADFLQLLEREPKLAIHLLKLLCERLRWTSALVEETAFLAGPARLAKRLLILASLHGRSTSVGELELRISQADLARFLNISRQIVNQNLREWQRSGWVDLGNSRIVIRRPEALRRVAETTAS